MVAKIIPPTASDTQGDGKYLIAVRLLDGQAEVFCFHTEHDRAMFLDDISRRYEGEFEWSLAESN